MKILVLGHRGMLGSMVSKYFSSLKNCEVETTELRWGNKEFKNELCNFKGEAIINCIGSIPQRCDEFSVNFELPIWLDKTLKCNIVHPATDCEMDEDDYGLSKRKAMDYFKNHGERTWAIKTSIIGPELSTSCSLLEWFLNTPMQEVKGYTHQMWNGITTLQWAKICWEIVNDFDSFLVVTIPYSECISKFALLSIIKEVYGKNINIVGSDTVKVNKCLDGNLATADIEQQLKCLLRFSEF
jgi:dTDP-4-dehydrorhamnose reductase